jgi:hypothetical protein
MLAGCRKSPEEADLEKWGDSTDPGSVEGGSQNSTARHGGGSGSRFYSNLGGGTGSSNNGTSEGHTGASSGGVSRGGFGGHGGGGGE